MNLENTKRVIEESLKKMVQSNTNLKNVYLLVHSDKHRIHWNMASGQSGDRFVSPEQSYHTASIGKSFTSILAAI